MAAAEGRHHQERPQPRDGEHGAEDAGHVPVMARAVAVPGAEVQVPVRVRGMPVHVRVPVETAAGRHPQAERAQRDQQDPPDDLSGTFDERRDLPAEEHDRGRSQEQQQRVPDREGDGDAYGMRAFCQITRCAHR